MALAQAPSSSSLSRMTRDRSGAWDNESTGSTSHILRHPTKPKRLQSAYLDENRGEWRCRNCGWTYPIPNPGHRERREHKKHCQGALKVRHWLGGGPSDDYGASLEAGTEQRYDASRVAATAEGTDTAAERPITKNDNDDGGKTRSDSHGVEGQSKTDDFPGTVDLEVRDPVMLDSTSTPEADTSLVETADAADALQGLSHDKPLGDEIQKESSSKEVQDVKPEGYGEQRQSGQQGIAAGGEKLEVEKEERDSKNVPEEEFKPGEKEERDSKNVPEEEFKPPVDDHARMPSSPERKESDIRPSHGADQDRTDHSDPSAVESSKVVETSKDSEVKNVQPIDNVNKLQDEKQAGSGTLEGKGIDSGGGQLVASQAELGHQSDEHSQKVGAKNEEMVPSLSEDIAPEDKPETVRDAKEREISLPADHKDLQEKAEGVEEVEEREPGLRAADDALREEAQVLEDGKPCIPPDDNSPKEKVSSVDEGFAPKEQDITAADDDALKEKIEIQHEDEEGEPTHPANDESSVDEGFAPKEQDLTAADDDSLKEKTEIQHEDEEGESTHRADDESSVDEGFAPKEQDLTAADDDGLKEKTEIQHEDEEGEPTHPANVESRVDEGFAPKEQDLTAADDDALKEKTEIQHEDEEGEPTHRADDESGVDEGFAPKEQDLTAPDDDGLKEKTEIQHEDEEGEPTHPAGDESSVDEGFAPKEQDLTAADDDGLKEKTEIQHEDEEGEPTHPANDESSVDEGFAPKEQDLTAADGDALKEKTEIQHEDEEGQPTHPANDKSSVDEGFAPKEQDLTAADEDALKEKTEIQHEDEEGESTHPADDEGSVEEGFAQKEQDLTAADDDAFKEKTGIQHEDEEGEPTHPADDESSVDEGFAPKEQDLTAANDDTLKEKTGIQHEDEEGEPTHPADDESSVDEGFAPKEQDLTAANDDTLKEKTEIKLEDKEGEPTHPADDDAQMVKIEGSEGIEKREPSCTFRDEDAPKENAEIVGQMNDGEPSLTADEKEKSEEEVEIERSEPALTKDDEDVENRLGSVPTPFTTDGTENKSAKEQQNLQVPKGNEASQVVSDEGELKRMPGRGDGNDEGEPSHMADETHKREEAVDVEGTEPNVTKGDREETDHVKKSVPRAVSTDGTENRSEEVQESLQIAGGTEDEASQEVSGEVELESKEERVGISDEGEPSHMADKMDKPKEAVEVEGTKPKFTEGDQDDKDHVKKSAPIAVATDGVEWRGGEEEQSLLITGFHEGSQQVALLGQSDQFEHVSAEGGDLHGQEITRIADAVSKPKDVATGQTSRGVVKLFSAQRNWDDWDFLLSGEDISSTDSKPPLLQKEDRQISHGQDHLKKAKEKQPEVPEDDSWELIDPEEGRDVEQVSSTTLRSQLDTGKKVRVAVKLSVAETNWDDWEDVIKGGLMLIQVVKLKNTEAAESALGDRQPSPSQLDDPKSGDVSVPVQVKTASVSEPEGVIQGEIEHQTDTAATGLTLHTLEDDGKDGDSAVKVEDPETKLFEVLKLEEGSSNQLQGEKLHSTNVISQPETGQTSTNPPELSLADRNWEDWENVVRESGVMSRQEKTDPVLEPDLGFGEHYTGLESPRLVDVDTVEGDSIVGGYEALRSAHGDSLRIANNPGKEAEDPNHEKSREAMATSVPQEERGQGGKPNLSETGETGANWKDVTRIEYVSHGNGLSSPSVQETQDGKKKKSENGGLLSQLEFASAQSAALTGLETWADIEDPTRSEYILFHEPVGGSVTFRERNYARGSLPFRSVSLDGPDVSGLPSLRRRAARKPPPFRETDRKRLPSQKRGLRGASQRRSIIEFDCAAGSLSSGGMKGTSRHIPALPQSKSEPPDSTGNKPSLLTRRDGSDELQEGDITSKFRDHYWHDHYWHEHSLLSGPVVQHDVVRLLSKQTKYNLICPICGSLITRQIILRKKKRRLVREKHARFRKSLEIIPVALDDDDNQISGSGTSSDIEDEKWNGGFVACLGYFFCA